jgi:hypothetical protein
MNSIIPHLEENINDNDIPFIYYPGCDGWKNNIPEFHNGLDKNLGFIEVLKKAKELNCILVTKNGNGKWYIKAKKAHNKYHIVKEKLDKLLIKEKRADKNNHCYLLLDDNDLKQTYISTDEEFKDNNGYLYFIRLRTLIKEHMNFTKIGRSINPQRRLKEANTWLSCIGSPYIYKEISCKDYVNAELIMHRYLKDRQFKPNGKKTEWFLLDTDTIDQICTMLK